MIRLQRASAGSGKTYTLAVTYLQYFLGIKQSDGRYRLRTDKELTRSHSHILAVTFTRRATNEMKDRIVGRLAQMAYAPRQDLSFLQRFAEAFDIAWPAGAEPAEDVVEQIARTAQRGLREMLGNYSDMNVSTIDSFFQSVLRAFSYETDMPDDYMVELDDNLVIEQSLDNVLRQARDAGGDEDARYWLQRYMDMCVDTGRRWNVMRKGDTAYREVMEFLRMISREEFKATRLALTGFFAANKDFRINAQEVNTLLDSSLQSKHEAVSRAAAALSEFIEVHLDGGAGLVNAYLLKRLKDICTMASDAVLSGTLRYADTLTKAGKNRVEQGGLQDSYLPLTEVYYTAQDEWVSEVKYAAVIRENLHILGLLRPLLEQINRYLKENNVVQLSDTSSFLSKIINNSDAPFIYEKIGYYLRHYLIDEFQDTSRMQWNNLKPLLDESLSGGADGSEVENDSLIIGDAKQSIYRFRNADPGLITRGVEQVFGSKVELRGITPQENTNYRSSGRVVEFNNALFKALCDGLEGVQEVYANVEQQAAKATRPGFVQVTLSDLINLPAADNADDGIAGNAQPIPYLGQMITNLLERGYRQNEIAVLVRTNKLGKAVIDAIMEYNATLPPEAVPISFISADSLEIGRSKAVKTVVSVLRMLTGITNVPKKRENDTTRSYTPTAKGFVAYLDSIRASDYGKDTAELVEEYFHGGERACIMPDLSTIVSELKSAALPAIVETIISRYVRPQSLLATEAPFIAAFQDMVVDYCERFPADVASFLRYYELKGKTRTIASPQGTEAVNILTIHSSKGLQFRVVICPEMRISTVPYREKLWVYPDPQATHPEVSRLLPELLPVAASAKRLEGTPWQAETDRLNQEALLDAVNMTYVAFTRAEDELYVVLANSYDSRTQQTMPPANSISAMIWEKLNSQELMLDKALYHTIDGSRPGMAYGTLPSTDQIVSLRAGEDTVPAVPLQGYITNSGRCRVEFTTEDNESVTSPEEENDELPTFSGEAVLCRRILQRLTTASRLSEELTRALLVEEVNGTASSGVLSVLRSTIEGWLQAPGVPELFADGLRVLNRRRLLNVGGNQWKGVSRYIDRLVIDSKGNAAAINIYPMTEPLGMHRTTAMQQLDALRQCNLYTTVRAMLWYPSASLLIPLS